MAKKFQLSIPEPCHEDWDQMHPVEKGRFCDSCQKQVVDFSNMSDFEVAQFFKKPSTGSLCGRFMTEQLDRTIEIPKKRIPWVKYFFQFVLPAFLGTAKVSAQGNVKVDTVKEGVYRDERIKLGEVKKPVCDKPATDRKGQAVLAYNRKIAGRVTDEKGEPVSFVSVLVKGTRTGVMADMNGLFSITAKTGDILVVSGVGYKVSEITVSTANAVSVVMKQAEMLLSGEVEVLAGLIVRRAPEKIRTGINGRVIDEEGNPVPFVTVTSTEFKKTVMADEQGIFAMNPKKKWSSTELLVSSVGFDERKMKIWSFDAKADTVFIELETKGVLEGVTITAYGYRMGQMTLGGAVSMLQVKTSWTDTVKNLFTKKMAPKIYPNPVQAGASVHIAIDKQEEGTYVFELLSMNGQNLLRKELWIDAEARVLNMEIPAVTAGTYLLRIMNKQNEKTWTEKIIVQ
jgi:hypothetical protein